MSLELALAEGIETLLNDRVPSLPAVHVPIMRDTPEAVVGIHPYPLAARP